MYVSPRRNICTALPGAAFFAMAMNSSNEVIFVLCHHSGGSPAGGPTPPIKGRFHRRSDEFLESIKKGVETPEKKGVETPAKNSTQDRRNQRAAVDIRMPLHRVSAHHE